MKALAVLGTASKVDKSWVVTTLGADLQRERVKAASFKVQSMCSNAYVTLDGGKLARLRLFRF